MNDIFNEMFEPILVDDYNSGYSVNQMGVVINTLTRKVVNPITMSNGRPAVMISFWRNGHGIYKHKYVARLVAESFIPNPDRCKYVAHYDGDVFNCNASNLYWTNTKEIKTKGFSSDEIIEMFNAVRDGHDSELFIRSGEWVKRKLQFVIRHMKEQNLPVDGKMLLIAYRRVISKGVDRYEISPFGIVHNINTDRYMFGSISNKYPVFSSDIDGKLKPVPIHRLVAQAFIVNPGYNEIHHINGEKIDACAWNLKWCDHLENMTCGIALQEITNGENRSASKYTNEQIHEVCKLIDEMKYSPRTISKMTGIDVVTINHIRNGDSWKHISMQYKMPCCRYDPKTEELIGINHKMTCRVKEQLDVYRDKVNRSPDNDNLIYIPEFYKI